MDKRVLLGAFLVVGVLCAAVYAGTEMMATRASAQDRTTAVQAVVEEAAEPEEQMEPVTLETIRANVTFSDLAAGSDYDAAGYAVYYELLSQEGGTFDPYTAASRAEVAVALYRLSGETAPEERTVYDDVPQDASYADAVAWVSAAGIASGTGANTFAPDTSVTRSQLAVMLRRFAAYRGDEVEVSGDLSAYKDGSQVADYAEEAMTWADEQGLYRAVVREDTLYPTLPVSRLQLAQALVALQSPVDELAQEIQNSSSTETASNDAPAHHEDIQAAVDSAAKKYGAVGVQVAVVENGQVSDTFAYGWATKNTDAMTADHKLRVASLSKVLVGVSAMLLREDGVIDLDAPIGDYWGFSIQNPQYPDKTISIRTLLTHTSSIFNAGDDESRAYSSVKRRLQGTGFSSAVPGDLSSWNYNNYAFGVLGMTLEQASNKYLDTILNQRLFNAMEIDGSFSAGEIKNKNLLTTIYRSGGTASRTVEAQKNMKRWDTPGTNGTYFAGGFTVSARDLGKIVAMLTQDGRFEGVQMMEPESIELMESYSEQTVSGGSHQALPMRYWENIYGRDGLYFHTGSAYGVYNAITYDPVTGDGVVVLTTGASGSKDDYGIYSVCAEISEYIYETIK